MSFYHHISAELATIKNDGLYKSERLISSAQTAQINVSSDGTNAESAQLLRQ